MAPAARRAQQRATRARELELLTSSVTEKAPAFAPNTEPIANAAEDALGRGAFADRVCIALAAWDLQKGSLVIGIDGDWREGKSSLMTLMKVRLEQSGYLYRGFHPWLFADESLMSLEFFRVVHGLIDKHSGVDDLRKKALAKLKAYAPTVLSGGGAPGVAAGKILERALASPSVLDQRNELRQAMGKLPKPVVICVEDIDRLTPIEALRIATLIRLVGSFPNVIYLLPYDRKNFTRLLDIALTQRESPPDQPRPMGEGFCERLVQLDIRLPRATSAELMNLLDREIGPAVMSAGITLEVTATQQALQRFFEMYQLSGVGDLFRTPRDVTRFAGSLALVLSACAGQVNLLDMLLLEVLRLHLPIVYERLRLAPQRYAVEAASWSSSVGMKRSRRTKHAGLGCRRTSFATSSRRTRTSRLGYSRRCCHSSSARCRERPSVAASSASASRRTSNATSASDSRPAM